MNIKPRSIPKFQTGGVPQWYLDRYGNRTSLLGWDLNKHYNYSNQNLNTNDHRNAGNLDKVYSKNIAYTGTPGAISSDIQSFYDSDGNGMSAEDFVNFYNQNAAKIRNHWALNLTYNTKTAREHNRLFKKMFKSRSDLSQSPGSSYNIGYLDDLEDIEGSSTWLRRMDLYENEFDENNPDLNRLHKIQLKDGTFATVYKKANGDIGLLKNHPQLSISGVLLITPLTTVNIPKLSDLSTPWALRFKFNILRPESEGSKTTLVEPKHKERYGFDWSKVGKTFTSVLGNPNVLAFGRLAGNLINNERVFDELIKGISPDLKSSYHTYRLVVGDEATKQGYYRRAAQGLTKAAQPFTSDADRLMAYQFELKRIGDELRAQGDLADNLMILKTSDEANQHAWANTQRDTEVANVNRASINLANALKHNLLALKHSALWSSIDNFLQGIEYRKRQGLAEQLAINDLIFTLRLKHALLNDPRLLNALKEFLAVLDKHKTSTGGYDQNDPEVLEAKRKYLGVYNQLAIELYLLLKDYYKTRNSVFSAKSGTKITHKKKDDLLYKSTKDVVEHFRKMSKISSDALNRKKPKIEKLAPHPKGKTKKYLLGGVAPFTIYKPVALGGETTTSSEASTSRTAKSSKDSDGLDLLKELFKSLQTEGLPSDVNGIYTAMLNLLSKQQMFGNELSTEDIASMYVLQMLQINNVKFFKKQFDDVLKIVNEKDAGSEFAIDLFGRVAVLDKEGKVSYMKWSELRNNLDKYNPLHNNDILNLRALSPSNAFNSDLLLVASNATSMSEIAKFLKAQLPNIGQSEKTIEGYTKKDSNDIKEGLRLLKDAPTGDYKYSEYTKEQLNQAKMALGYLKSILPKNMKTLLEVNSEIQGVSSDAIISAMIGSTLNENYRLEFDAVTGKAASNKGTGGGGNGTDTPASVQFLLGNGYSEIVEFNIGNSQSVKALGRFGILLDKEKNNLGLGSTLQDVSKSLFGPILDLDKATFGGTRLTSSGYTHIILNNSDCIGVDLPVKRDLSGNYIPDFLLLSIIEKAEEQIHNNKITDPQQINKIYRDLGLPDKFDSNGNIIPQNYRRFAGILVILDSKALKGGIPVNTNEISEADDEERELFIEEMKKNGNEDYDLSDGFLWSSWGKDKLYKGTIFIPVREDIVAGYTSGGYPLDTDLPNNANLVAIMLYAPKTQQYLKTPPLSSLK